MYAIFAFIAKFAFIILIFLFILRIADLIYKDMKSILSGEEAKRLMPHLELMALVGGKPSDLVADLFVLNKQVMIIGRSPNCDIIISQPHISSHHARLEVVVNERGTSYTLLDLNSANGTLVNGQRIKEATPIRNGDKILLGHTLLRLSEGGHNYE